MSDDDNYTYRPRFTDIRVKPPADDASRERAKKTRTCEHKGCDLEGTHPAPKQRGNGKHHFCQRHVAEYNRSFNFFDGMSEGEAASFTRNERFGHQKTWKFGAGPMSSRKATDPKNWKGRSFFDMEDTANRAQGNSSRRTRMETRALKELGLQMDAEPSAIRARYAEYVRRFHPDSNKGDRSSEEKLERVVKAGKVLKTAGLMKDK